MPVVVERSYEKLKQENKELKYRIIRAIEFLQEDKDDSAYNALKALVGI